MSDLIAAPPNTPPTAQARGGKSSFTGNEILTSAIQTASCIDASPGAVTAGWRLGLGVTEGDHHSG